MADKSEESNKKLINEYVAARDLAIEYCQPYFDKFVRFSSLFQGILPPELDGTHSKVMLSLPYAMVENELPRSTRAFSTTDWFDLKAREPELEMPKNTVKKWLKYQMEDVQQFPSTIVPTLQSCHVFGTAYRVYSHRFVTRTRPDYSQTDIMGIPIGIKQSDIISKKSVISGQYTSIFNVLPLPGGSLVNPVDDTSQCAVDGVIWVDYMTQQDIETAVLNGIFDKDQAKEMMDSGAKQVHPAESYLQQTAAVSNNWNASSMPAWIRDTRTRNRDLVQRFMVAWYFKRNRWVAIGEDNWVLYQGAPAIDAIPIAKFTAGYSMEDWFGKGLIELTEDLLISITLNLNMRLDYLSGVFHPQTFIHEDLLDHHNGDLSIFDPQPYNKISFPRTIQDITKAVYHERMPEITQQTFMDEDRMNSMLEKVSGQSDLLKGLSQGGGAEGTAMGMSVLSNSGTARSLMRACNIENSGVRDSLWLTLKYGSKYKNDEEWIREPTADGFPWSQVPTWMIDDNYSLEVTGNRSLQMAEDTVRKMLTLAPMLVGNPAVPNQRAVLKVLMEKTGFENVDEILGPEQQGGTAPQQPGAAGGQQQGAAPGIGGASTVGNDMQGMAGGSPAGAPGMPSAAGRPMV